MSTPPTTRVDYLHTSKRAAWLAVAERWALPAVLLVALALRLYRLGDKNIWWDEGLAIWAVRKSLWSVTQWTGQDVHPPLYFYHLWAWVRLVGESEFAARFISAIWGVLTVALVYPLGTRLGGRRVGLLAALFLAVARFHIWWSQEMRMYILAALAATLTLYLAVRWLDEETGGVGAASAATSRRAWWAWPVLYTVAAAGCLYTIYMAGLAPLVANLYAVMALARIPRVRRLGVAARWLGAQAAALLIFLPWALYTLSRMHTWSVAAPYGLRQLVTLYSTLLSVGVSTDIERYAVYVLPFAATLVGGLATLLWQRRRSEPGLPGAQAALLLALAVASMPLVVYILTQPRSLFYTPRVEARYLVLFAPAFCAFLGWSVVRLGRRLWPLGLAALVACLGLMLAFLPGYYDGRYLQDQMQTMSHLLGAHARPDDVVLLISGDRYQLFGYYYEQLVPPERRVPVLELPRALTFTPENVAAELEAATAGRSRFWVAAVETSIQDPEHLSLPWLDAHFPRAFTQRSGTNELILYGQEAWPQPVAAANPQYPLSAGGEGLQLLGYDLPGREYAAGDAVDLGLYYKAEAPVAAEIQWLRRDGTALQTVAQEWPATAPAAGRAALRLEVWPWYAGGATRVVVRWPATAGAAAHSVELPGPRILEQPNRPRPERIAQPLDAGFAQGIGLLGYDLHRSVQEGTVTARPGETLTLDLFWQAGAPLAQDYTVFVHLLGAAHNPRTNGPVWAQHDGPPVDGRYATGQWLPGQVIADRHVLTIDPGAPQGDYELEIGLYLPATGERLRTADGADRVVIARVRVE
ncbi:MAG TPA: glycosyltransferase family 39 protein [Anaerolineae bacterium]|nr:glycosyltransferase family 39 protein [Anaerolineae bacterium]HOQ98492.1 glycosyltransferase family 39 protein [Anaerolineae bacterium]HPL28110.1 glycosyltransferase family 39 protein [Anaerolineae bacterium]